MNTCEFCGKKKKTATTEFNGDYCISCYWLVIIASVNAIREIQGKPPIVEENELEKERKLKELIDSIKS